MKRSDFLAQLKVFIDTELLVDIDPEQADELLVFIEDKMCPEYIQGLGNHWEEESK